MFYYGFLIENNRKNAVYIKLYHNRSDPLEGKKTSMVGFSYGNCIKTFKYFEDFKDSLEKNNKFLGYLRFLQYSGDLKAICPYFTPAIANLATAPAIRRKLRLPSLSIENETKMLEKLRESANKCLKKFPNTYEEDQERLSNKSLTFNERNAIIYRAGEKKVLLALMYRSISR